MNLDKATCKNSEHPSCNVSHKTQSASNWESELKELIGEELANGNIYQVLLGLLNLLQGWCRLGNSWNEHEDITIHLSIEQLPEHLRYLTELLEDQDQREFLLALIDEVIWLLKCEEQALFRSSRHQYLSYLANCTRSAKNACVPLMRVTTSEINHSEYPFPLRLTVVDNDRREIEVKQNSITIDGRKCELKEKSEEFCLDAFGESIVDLRLSRMDTICFIDCYRMLFLDLSCTFLCHVDARELIGLEVLRLTNTNVMRLNLANQRRLKHLCCSYTLIDYLRLPNKSLLRDLYVEYSGEHKLNWLNSDSEACIDERETVEDYEGKNKMQKRKKLYAVCYAERSNNQEEVKVTLLKRCEAFIDRNIKPCRKMRIESFSRYKESTVGPVNIADYPNLETLSIKYINCSHFRIRWLPLIVSIKICVSELNNILIVGLPALREVKLTCCDCLGQVKVEECEKVEFLDFYNTKVEQLNLKRFRELRALSTWSTNVTQLDVSENIKLEKLLVCNTKISELDVSQLIYLRELEVQNTGIAWLDVSNNAELKILQAFSSKISQIDVSHNAKLEDLELEFTGISALDVSQLAELKKLYANDTAITELDVSRNTKLEELRVDNTKISQLDVRRLAELKTLWISKTGISRIDLAGNRQLVDVFASRSSKVLNCWCVVHFASELEAWQLSDSSYSQYELDWPEEDWPEDDV